jgi:hypothetical protein
MTRLSTIAPHTADRPSLRIRSWWLPALLAVALIVAALPRIVADPAMVHRITLVNRTVYAMHVEVTGGQRDGWTGVGIAEREDTTVVRDVVDQGRSWIFRFESQGFVGGELRLAKGDLARSGWRVVISESVGERLARQGASPTPLPTTSG